MLLSREARSRLGGPAFLFLMAVGCAFGLAVLLGLLALVLEVGCGVSGSARVLFWVWSVWSSIIALGLLALTPASMQE